MNENAVLQQPGQQTLPALPTPDAGPKMYTIPVWLLTLVGTIAAVLITVALIVTGVISSPQTAEDTSSTIPEIDFTQLTEVDKEAFLTAVLDGGVITSAQIVDGTITSDKLSPGAVIEYPDGTLGSPVITEGTILDWHLADGSITTAKIVDEAVTSVKLADGSVTAAKIKQGAVTSSEIADGTIQLADLGFDLPSSSGGSATATIADGSVTSVKLAGNSVDGSKVVNGSLTGSDIQNGSITSSDLAANSVGSSQIIDGGVTAADIANLSITAAEIATGTITADKLVGDGSIVKSIVGTSSLVVTNNLDGSYSIELTGSCADGEVLAWDAGIPDWECVTLGPGGSTMALANLTDVTTATPTAGNILIADGANWSSQPTTNIVSLGTVTTGVWEATAVDISSYTNLAAGNNITLNGDTLDVDDNFLLNTGDSGTGNYDFSGTFDLSASILQGANALMFEGANSDSFQTSIFITEPTADRTITIPDRDGIVALTSDITGMLSDSGDTGAGPYIFTGTMDLTGTVLQGANALVFEGATDDDYETQFTVASLTADRSISIPDASGTILLDSTLGTTYYLQGGNAFGGMAVLGTTDGNALSVITDSAERLNISTGGDVLIGTGTATSALHVLRDDGTARLLIEETSATVASRELLRVENNGGTRVVLADSDSGTEWVVANEASTFSIDDPTIGMASELVIDDSGNVGVGTDSPNEKLTVDGVLSLAETSTPTATSGYGKLFVDSSDGDLKYMDPTGDVRGMNEIEHMIKDFVVASGETITAGDVVSMIDGQIQKGPDVNNTKLEDNFVESSGDHPDIAALTDDTFILAWSDIRHDNDGRLVVGTIVGTEVIYSDEYQFTPNEVDYTLEIEAISSTHFVMVYYDDTDNASYALVGEYSGGSVSFGTKTTITGGYTTLSIAQTAANQVIIAGAGLNVDVVVGTISGTSISFGVSANISSSTAPDYLSIDALDSTHFVVVWGDTSTPGMARVGTLTGAAVTSLGTAVDFNPTAQDVQYLDVAAVDSTHFVIGFQDTADSNYGKLEVAEVSGETITLGSEHTFSTNAVRYIEVQPISSTQVAVNYIGYVSASSSYTSSVYIATISGTSISGGSTSDYDTNNSTPSYGEMAMLSGTKLITVHDPSGDRLDTRGRQLATTVGNISGTNVTYGYNYDVDIWEEAFRVKLAKLSSDKFLLAYEAEDYNYGSLHTTLAIQVATLSDGEIEYGPVEEVRGSSLTHHNEIDIAVLSSTSFVIGHRIESSGSGSVAAGSISGNVITLGANVSVNGGTAVSELQLTALNSTTFVAVWRDTGSYTRAEAFAGTVSGTTITEGAIVIINGNVATLNLAVDRIDDNRFIVAYSDNGANGETRIGTVTGTTVAIGGAAGFTTSLTSVGIDVARYSSSGAIVVLPNGSGDGELYLADTSGATATYSSAYVFEDVDTVEYAQVAPLDSYKFVVVYEVSPGSTLYMRMATLDDEGDVNFSARQLLTNQMDTATNSRFDIEAFNTTDYIVGYINNDSPAGDLGVVQIHTTLFPVVGIAAESGTSGQTVGVIIDGISDNHTGLITGETYYSDSSGNLSATQSAVNDIYVGVAISPTELYLATSTSLDDKFFGDMHFANNFRITEATSYQGLIYVNQRNDEILSLNENGKLESKVLSAQNLTYGDVCATVDGVIANCSADDDQKANIETYDDALTAIMGLRPVGFDWATGSSGKVGLIASEVASIDPTLVTYYGEEIQDIDYKQLSALMVRGLQQTQEQLQAMALGDELQGGRVASLAVESLTVTANAEFTGDVTVLGHLAMGVDSVGEVELLAGDTEVRVEFEMPYSDQPIVTVTPQGSVAGNHWVADVNEDGFTLYLSEEQESPLKFSWHAIGSRGGKITISDGTSQDVTLVESET